MDELMVYPDTTGQADAATDGSGLLGGRYRVDELISRGDSAFVYRGFDPVLNRPVAIRPATDQCLRTLPRLGHPGLVRLYDIVDGPPPYLILEYVPGETLDARLARGPLPAREVAVLAAELAGSLAHLHAQCLVHGAVSAANVLLDANGRPRLTGTPRGAGPDDSGPTGEQDDVKALGRILQACAAGRTDRLPPALADLVREMTAADPTDRPCAAEVAARAGVVSVPAPGPVHPELSGGSHPRHAQKGTSSIRTLLVTAGVTLMLISGGGLLAGHVLGGGPPTPAATQLSAGMP